MGASVRAVAPASAATGAAAADDALLLRVAAGCDRSFDEFYGRHSTAAYSVARAILHDAHAAQDVVQAAFLDVWRHAAVHDPSRGSARTWLLGIVRHRAIDALRRTQAETRREARVVQRETVQHRQAPLTHDLVAASQDGRVVRAAVAALPPRQREVVECAYYHGLSHSEISVRLALPIGTVKSRLRLALERMGTSLGCSTAA